MSIEKLRTEIRREQIAQAALQHVAAHGMKALSMATLARRVGLVPSALYRHFKNKDQVLDAVLDLLRERLMGNVEMVRNQYRNPMEQLKHLLALHLRLILEYQALPRMLFSEELYGGHPERKSRVYGIITAYLGEVSVIIRQGQQQGQLQADVPPETAALIFLGLIQPSAILWHLSDGRFDAARHVEKAWPVFARSIERATSYSTFSE